MTQTEEYEYQILKELILHGDKGGMKVAELKELFYRVLGSKERGEEFFTYMRTSTNYLSNVGGPTTEDYFVSAEGGFHLDNLKSMYLDEGRAKSRRLWNGLGISATLIVAILTLINTCHPPESRRSYSKPLDSSERAKFQHKIDSAVKFLRDSAGVEVIGVGGKSEVQAKYDDDSTVSPSEELNKVEVIGADGKIIRSNEEPPPPPKKVKGKPVIKKVYDCCDATDSLEAKPPKVK